MFNENTARNVEIENESDNDSQEDMEQRFWENHNIDENATELSGIFARFAIAAHAAPDETRRKVAWELYCLSRNIEDYNTKIFFKTASNYLRHIDKPSPYRRR